MCVCMYVHTCANYLCLCVCVYMFCQLSPCPSLAPETPPLTLGWLLMTTPTLMGVPLLLQVVLWAELLSTTLGWFRCVGGLSKLQNTHSVVRSQWKASVLPSQLPTCCFFIDFCQFLSVDLSSVCSHQVPRPLTLGDTSGSLEVHSQA